MFSCPTYLRNRQYGIFPRWPWKDALYSLLYKSVQVSTCSETTPSAGQDWGAVFGFGFSPDGSLLVAACENNCMLVYDPNNARLITRRFNAHTSCVNCVSFLDNRMFVTCSDDSTVRVWDARSLNQELKVLEGHTAWVKNIEYCPSAGKLITSGFDGNIFAWDINNYSESNKPEQLLYMNGMMRTKVCPDEKRMILSTLGGCFILIHDLDIDHLKDDLNGFRPRMYGSMHLLNIPLAGRSLYSNMFTRKRNRVEFISDFPVGDNAESISAMEVHPQGWCIVSRNTTADKQSEWTCVHDIQAFNTFNQGSKVRDSDQDSSCNSSTSAAKSRKQQVRMMQYLQHHSLDTQTEPHTVRDSHSTDTDSSSSASSSPLSSPTISGFEQSSRVSNHDRSRRFSPPNVSTISNHITDHNHRNCDFPSSLQEQTATKTFMSVQGDECVDPSHSSLRPPRRLIFHSEEPNLGHGYIKEQSFSADGRIIASPFGNCVRLLAFDADCRELCDVVTSRPRPLRQIGLTAGNHSCVLSSTFSPTHLMYVAGSEDGSISFCSPKL